jgi:hypothetical protein
MSTYHDSHHWQVIWLPDIIHETQHWKQLTELSLRAVITTEVHLRNVLFNHTNTLRSLELANIDFRDFKNRDRSNGSWVDFFGFLNQSMTLHRV